jgi:two-component sensor histidine kinase
MATNAAKYGALAQPGGTLDVEWMTSEDENGRKLTLKWTERGVKIGDANAVKEGFGMRLIRSAVTHDLGGKVEYRMAAAGPRLTLNCPL